MHGGALLFGLWAAANTALTVVRYGADQGMYFWFCNLHLVAVAVGLRRRDPSLLLAFLGVAVLTQPLYLADSLSRLAGGAGLFEAAEFMYQPGMGIGEFLLSRYHYFLIPVSFFALLKLPRERDRTTPYVVAFNVLIFGTSYFVFPAAQNVNCIHESCVDFFGYKGWLYSLGFFLLILSGNWLAAKGLDRLTRRLAGWHHAGKALAVCLGAGLVLVGLELGMKTKQPKFACDRPFEDSGIRVKCLYTLEHGPALLELHYEIENKLPISQQCDTRMDFFDTGEYQELHERLYLKPHETMKLTTLLPYPDRDVKIKVAAACLRFH